jgi:membrane-associated phospholipid phosphatase
MTARIARAIGIVCGPPLIPVALAFLATWSSQQPYRLLDLTTFVVSLAVLPAMLVYGAYRAGYISDMGMPIREQRVLVATLSVLAAVFGAAALWWLGAQWTLVALATGTCLQLILLDLLTLRDKVSYHSAGAGGLAVAGFYLAGLTLGVVLVAVAIATGWSRWYLGKHTLRQVAAGLATSLTLGLWLLVSG